MASGKKERLSLTGVYTMRRPDRFYAKMTGGRGLESWYNGKMLTIAAHPEKVFAQAPMPETIDRTLDALAERYDMALPMGDLFYGSAEKALLSDTTTGGYVGTENVGDTPCVHLAFQDIGVDWELWLPAQGEPLPKRFKVVQNERTGQPVVDLTFTAWDLAPQISDATFVPKVPADYEGIAILQRAAAVKNAAAGGGGRQRLPRRQPRSSWPEREPRHGRRRRDSNHGPQSTARRLICVVAVAALVAMVGLAPMSAQVRAGRRGAVGQRR